MCECECGCGYHRCVGHVWPKCHAHTTSTSTNVNNIHELEHQPTFWLNILSNNWQPRRAQSGETTLTQMLQSHNNCQATLNKYESIHLIDLDVSLQLPYIVLKKYINYPVYHKCLLEKLSTPVSPEDSKFDWETIGKIIFDTWKILYPCIPQIF